MHTNVNFHISYERYLIDITVRKDTRNEVTYKLFKFGYCFKYSLDTFDISLLSRLYLKK